MTETHTPLFHFSRFHPYLLLHPFFFIHFILPPKVCAPRAKGGGPVRFSPGRTERRRRRVGPGPMHTREPLASTRKKARRLRWVRLVHFCILRLACEGPVSHSPLPFLSPSQPPRLSPSRLPLLPAAGGRPREKAPSPKPGPATYRSERSKSARDKRAPAAFLAPRPKEPKRDGEVTGPLDQYTQPLTVLPGPASLTIFFMASYRYTWSARYPCGRGGAAAARTCICTGCTTQSTATRRWCVPLHEPSLLWLPRSLLSLVCASESM